MRNLEIKARVASLSPARARLNRLRGAAREPVVRQTDWYFRVPKGRLKLRVLGGRRDGELILYVRPDRASVRTSTFQVLPVADATAARALLEAMFGLRACVRKRREVWISENARIHLDSVDGLGRFVEIEVVVSGGAAQARALMAQLRGVLGIRSADLIAGSYAEMPNERSHALGTARGGRRTASRG